MGGSAASAAPKVTVVEIEESDNEHTENKRGPTNTSRDHFHLPAPVTSNQGKRWEFRCHHCTKSYTFKRTLDKSSTFDAEKLHPHIGNLGKHIHEKHAKNTEIPGAVPRTTPEVSVASAKIMEGYLLEGKLNPAVNPTQKGFNKLPTDTTVRNTLANIYAEMFETLKTELKNVKSKIAGSTDT
ncbi:hypothetical protein B0H10DRAFT_1962286 [Mycena sp. CBHHK59/15]|nr:hypothetical protein B0H10DRAFT_1962286 [Mycena sp. CBHHK59/15]